MNIRGDMLSMTERVMDELSSLTGLDYSHGTDVNGYYEFRDFGLNDSSSEHINSGAEKVNIVPACNPEMTAIQSAFEKGFSSAFEVGEQNYQYGFVFVYFLEEIYGKGTFMRIVHEAETQDFQPDHFCNPSGSNLISKTGGLIEIIRTAVGNEVFDRFAV